MWRCSTRSHKDQTRIRKVSKKWVVLSICKKNREFVKYFTHLSKTYTYVHVCLRTCVHTAGIWITISPVNSCHFGETGHPSFQGLDMAVLIFSARLTLAKETPPKKTLIAPQLDETCNVTRRDRGGSCNALSLCLH